MAGLFRSIWQQTAIWLFCGTFIPLMALAMLVTLCRKRDTLGTRMSRMWGKTGLWIAGVTLAFDPTTLAELRTRTARVLLFNHSSSLDLLVGASLMHDGAVVVVKRELLSMPFIGWVLPLLDFVTIDRSNRQAAADSLAVAASRIASEKLTVMIAPEGTRSKDGSLGPFKMGPFHLAIAAGVPLLPVVMHNCAKLWPRGRAYCLAGVVRIEALPAIPTAGRTAADVHELADSARQAYERALARA